MRGKYGSEGDYVMNRPLHGPQNPTPVDHATDTYDTIDWLVTHTPESNGKVGILGISYDGSLPLMALGMKKAFGPGADLSGIGGSPGELFITAVVHKAFVDVNEEGTEAAAATAVVVGKVSAPPPPPVFRADHPFLFMIRDKRSDSVLFLGRLAEPK